jgi:guanylate kinase
MLESFLSKEDLISGLWEVLKNKSLKLWTFYNEDGLTSLHQSISLNLFELSKEIIKSAHENLSQKDYSSFINWKTNKGQTPLHYASFVGNINIDIPDVNALDSNMIFSAELIDHSDKNKKPLLILGPSGVGKDTMINMLKEKYPNILFKLPSYTTRAKRPGEIEGIDYFFVSQEEFKIMESQGKLFGIQKYNNNFYASNKSKLGELIDNGNKIIILNYNIETANCVRNEFDFNFVAILPPSKSELRNRLINRGTNPEEIESRMQNSIKELNLINNANYIQFTVENNDINICFIELENHIKELYPKFF